MSKLCSSLDEFILNTSQLTNSGKKFHVNIYRSDRKRNIKGVLQGIRPRGEKHLIFFGGDGGVARGSNTMEIGKPIEDVESLSQLRLFLRQLLLSDGWTFVGSPTHKI